jgi:Phage ABA sandwich domain
MTDQELNEAVARKLGWAQSSLLGWISPSTQYRKPDDVICQKPNPPDFCHSIQAAWEIVEFMSSRRIGTYLFGGIGKAWHCDLHTHPAGQDDPGVSQSAYSAPMAICRAFLKLT